MQHPWNHFHPFVTRAAMRMPPEWAHRCALNALRCGYPALPPAYLEAPTRCMGLDFANPVGLAAGLDKNAVALPAWQRCGFGFVEVGAVTPRAQPGNPAPRLFRIPEHRALINRMGFNNDGMARVRARLVRFRRHHDSGRMRVGVNLGKNKDTPLHEAAGDYVVLLEAFWSLADYLCMNISSPNTPELRALEQPAQLESLLETVMQAAGRLKGQSGRDTPIAIKIDPDQNPEQLGQMVNIIRRFPVRALIATNTTCQRPAPIEGLAVSAQSGGLSGAPLAPLALDTLKVLRPALSGSDIALVGCGGIVSDTVAREFVDNGAALLQIYTGFIYQGPQLIADLVSACPAGN